MVTAVTTAVAEATAVAEEMAEVETAAEDGLVTAASMAETAAPAAPWEYTGSEHRNRHNPYDRHTS